MVHKAKPLGKKPIEVMVTRGSIGQHLSWHKVNTGIVNVTEVAGDEFEIYGCSAMGDYGTKLSTITVGKTAVVDVSEYEYFKVRGRYNAATIDTTIKFSY